MRVAIQGECGSNSHMAAVDLLGVFKAAELVPCSVSADVVDAVLAGTVEAALLPIENSLHGSVAEHYDLLLAHPLRIERESLLRVRHNLIAMPGVKLEDVRCVLSHLVALSQCRTFLEGMRGVRAQPFYDTAGSVKHIMEERFGDTAAIAPALAAEEYGAEILVEGIEDHAENYTRFYLVRQAKAIENAAAANKCSVAFSVEHRPGTLVAALVRLAETGVDLTKIESRPVPGKPWEYVFYVEFRFIAAEQVDVALAALRQVCAMVKELGRFVAA